MGLLAAAAAAACVPVALLYLLVSLSAFAVRAAVPGGLIDAHLGLGLLGGIRTATPLQSDGICACATFTLCWLRRLLFARRHLQVDCTFYLRIYLHFFSHRRSRCRRRRRGSIFNSSSASASAAQSLARFSSAPVPFGGSPLFVLFANANANAIQLSSG